MKPENQNLTNSDIRFHHALVPFGGGGFKRFAHSAGLGSMVEAFADDGSQNGRDGFNQGPESRRGVCTCWEDTTTWKC